MAKKRKSENAALDEVERTLYTSFCTAANSISQLYTQAQNQQRIAFQAGERQGVERLYNWLLREHQNGSNITVAHIIQNLQSELEGGSGDEMTMSPQQHQQPSVVGPSGRTGALPALIDQGKISVFQGALSSPNRRSLPAFSGYTFVQQQPARRGTIDQQPTTDLREDELESAPYEAAAPPAAFGFPPPQSQQQQQQRPGAPPQSFNEPDASMDMNEHGVPEDHYYR
jgi:hypothetical protein